jgi:hypothetical protein
MAEVKGGCSVAAGVLCLQYRTTHHYQDGAFLGSRIGDKVRCFHNVSTAAASAPFTAVLAAGPCKAHVAGFGDQPTPAAAVLLTVMLSQASSPQPCFPVTLTVLYATQHTCWLLCGVLCCCRC